MRILSDYHVHTDISPDSDETMSNALARAAQLGIREIAFTDHYDEDYPGGDFGPPDLERYFRNLEEARSSWPDIHIASGIELGMVRASNEKIRQYLRPWQFDFVLFSKHVIGGHDPWEEDFFSGWTLREGERRYLQEMLEDIRAYDDFDVVGHIGYVDRYLTRYQKPPEETRPFTWADFPDELDTILSELVQRGKGIEINTSSLDVNGQPMPNASILKRYKELGGEIVTAGSDAHEAGQVGRGIRSGLEMLRDLGFRWICTYAGRKPQFRSLKDLEER